MKFWTKQARTEPCCVERVLEIVRERGKLHNPVTNSGGMLYGTVVELGPSYPNIYHIRPKDEIMSLSSLTVTPLHITQSSALTAKAPNWR